MSSYGKVRDCWGNNRLPQQGKEGWVAKIDCGPGSQSLEMIMIHTALSNLKSRGAKHCKALQQQQAFANPREFARVFKTPAMA